MKIGLIGLAGAGKDTTALILQRVLAEQGKHFEIDRYAGLLKEAARQVFGENFDDRDVKEEMVFITPDLADRMIDACDYIQLKLELSPDDFNVWNTLCERYIDSLTWVSPRLFQQLLGTDIGRALKPSIWVDYLQGQDRNLIIPDCRFGNENGDFNILIDNGTRPTGSVHASEAYALDLVCSQEPWLYVDRYVLNTGSLEELETKIRFLVTTLPL